MAAETGGKDRRSGAAAGGRRRQKRPPEPAISERDVEDIEEQSRLRAPLIYEVVRREGEEEMSRPITSLWWSGVAAGLSISFSLLAQAALYRCLPDAPWRPLVSSFGYSVGFIIVVLARQQLFTENTITVVLPVMARPTAENLKRLGRMWGIVLAANLVGTLLASAFWAATPVLTPALYGAMIEIGRHAMEGDWTQMFLRGIGAGFLIAAMVWLIPSVEDAQFYVVALMTYLIGIAGFAHIVAGSADAWVLIIAGQAGLWHVAAAYAAPVLLGNVVGGTLLFALISYAQVMREI